jgi:hypothetical protein
MYSVRDFFISKKGKVENLQWNKQMNNCDSHRWSNRQLTKKIFRNIEQKILHCTASRLAVDCRRMIFNVM